jgi:hypothetical protein
MSTTEDQVIALAAAAHAAVWSAGKDVSAQTQKAQLTCRYWQEAVKRHYGKRFHAEYGINGPKGRSSQKIDLVDLEEHVAYELKSSPNNVHMEIYRDVFKTLVFNERNPDTPLKKLVFIAPEVGIQKLGADFPIDVQTISSRMGLDLKLRSIP